jgi:RHS repeat-associated protein
VSVGWFALGRPRLSLRARRRWSARFAASATFLIISTATVGVSPIAAANAVGQSPDPGPGAASTTNAVPLAAAVPPAPITSDPSGGGSVPNGGVGVRVTPKPIQRPKSATDVPGLRTEYGNVTANPDGTYTALVSSGRVNFKATDGSWQPIDVSLVSESSAGYDLRTKANDRTVRVNDVSGADQMATLQAGTYAVSIRVLGTGAGTVSAAKTRVDFPAAGGLGAFAVSPTPEGLEFQATTTQATDANTFRIILDTGGLTASLAPDGTTVLLSDATGTAIGKISAPTVLDAAGQMAPAAAVSLAIETPAPGTILGDNGAAATTGGLPLAAPAVLAAQSPAPSPDPSAGPSPDPSAVGSPEPSLAPSAEPSIAPSPEPSPSDAPSAAPSPSAGPSAEPSPSPAPSGQTPPPNVVRPSEVVLAYTIDPSWLSDSTRTFPVTLDPTLCIRFGSGASGCDTNVNDTNANYGEGYSESAFPTTSPTGIVDQIGTDPTDGKQYAFYYFGHQALPDGAIVTNADFALYQKYGYGSEQLHTIGITSPWNHATIDWSNQPSNGGAWTSTINALGAAGWLHQDVTAIMQARYTRSPLDWKLDYGFQTSLVDNSDPCSVVNSTCWRIYVDSASETTASLRPQLAITYFVPQVALNFDASLGHDFAPSTMPVNQTVNLPVTVTNNGSGFTFNHTPSADYYELGYRWFDATGKYATGFTSSNVVNLPADIPTSGAGSTSATISLPVLSPPAPGQYGLRLDLVHNVNGTLLWASDWAQPSLYYARVKDVLATTSTTRWTGSSVVKRADFPISVVAGGGTAVGETKSVSLPDGSGLGINTWSHNLTYSGEGGVSFADLNTNVGLTYGYNSADVADCSGILAACGWWTNYDEGLTPGSNGVDFIYRDGAGNKVPINANGDGQLTGAPGQLDRPRYTVLDENWLGSWSGATPTVVTTPVYSGGHAYQIPSTTTAGTQSATIKVPLNQYPLVSFAATSTATGTAIGFHITDSSTGVANWLFYTLGTDFAVSGFTRINAVTGSIASYVQVLQRNIVNDAVAKGFGAADDVYVVDSFDFWGNGATGKVATYDAIRFEGRAGVLFDDAQPAWTAGATNATLNSVDHAVGAKSIQVAAASYALSPTCTACRTDDLTLYPYVHWYWKSLGGTTVSATFTLKDVRTGTSGSITYYAGPTAPSGAPNPIQIAASPPSSWTAITRNLVEDARSVLNYFDDHDTTGTESAPNGGPTPDQVTLTGFELMTVGGPALFDAMAIQSLPWLGDQYGVAPGDEFVLTLAGGATHRFNRDGKLTALVDLDHNVTALTWTYLPALVYQLTTVTAPSNGQPLVTGTAQRDLAVTTVSGVTTFTEQLGANGGSPSERKTIFTVAASDLSSVVPARWNAACGTGANPSGCILFGYTGTHLLTTISDPRKSSANADTTTVGWTGSDPMKITANASSSDELRILSWNAGSTWALRPEYEDADGIATGSNGYARYDDMTPNGSVLTEYAPVACSASNCTSAPAPSDILVSYAQDGADHYSTETHDRLTGSTGAVTSRRGTFAAAKVDNYSDALTAGLTAWSQTPEQYAASMAVSGGANPNLYVTNYTYNALGQQTSASTPYTNPVGTNNVAVQTVTTVYDPEGHPIEVSDKGFLTNTGFEAGLTGWTTSGVTSDSTTFGSGLYSAKLTGVASVLPAVNPELLPGQTFRFQAALKTASGTGVTYSLAYQKADLSWANLINPTVDTTTTWHTISFDVTIPLDGNGVVKPSFATSSGVANLDDVLIFTSFGASAYLTNGLLDSTTDVLGHVTKLGYDPGATYPAIFPTKSTANYTGGSQTNDSDVLTLRAYDTWGRALVATDPDGITTTTAYGSNMTDVASVTDGLGNVTSYPSYDAIGERLTSTDPIGATTTMSYSFFGHPIDTTGPDGSVTHDGYDALGRLSSITANYLNGGSGTSGVANVLETKTLDQYGRVTRDVADSGVSGATTDTSYDLVGNVISSTVYPVGTSNPRTTTTYFDAAGTPAGTAGPIVPTGSPAPACPGAPSSFCNSAATIDLAGRTISTTDAYGKATLTWADFEGKPVEQIDNFVVAGGLTADQNVTSTMRYDPSDHIVAATDPLGRVTSTVYDNLDRITKLIKPDGSWTRTNFTPGGRVDATSRPGSSAQGDADVAWTKNIYDAAGRLVTDLANYDTSANAQDAFDGFEGGVDANRWLTSTDGFLTASATLQTDTLYSSTVEPETGLTRLRIATTGTAGQGIRWDLSHVGDLQIGRTGAYTGPTYTFKAGHTYTLTADLLNASPGTSLAINLGTIADHGSAVTTALPTNVWTRASVTWTPVADRTSGVDALFTNPAATSTSYKIDDVWVSDNASTNRNIPTSTVYDPAGRVIESVVAPGAVPAAGSAATTNLPLVTGTAYDPTGRAVAVVVNAIAAYPGTIKADTPHNYWPLDEPAGTTIHDRGASYNLTASAGLHVGVAGGVDEPRTAGSFDGTAANASASSAASAVTDNFSLEAWFRADALPSSGNYAMIAYNGTDTAGWGLALDSTGQIVARYGGVAWLASGAVITLGSYYYVALVRTSGTATIYANGSAYTPTNSTSTPLTAGASFSIGREDATAGRYFTGRIDEVAVYETALAGTRISAHYAAGRIAAPDVSLATRSSYDALGDKTESVDPAGVVTHLDYDRRANVIATTADYVPGATAGAIVNVKSTFAYDNLRELTASCPAGRVQADACDPTVPSTSSWRQTYDAAGHVIDAIPPVNATAAALVTTTAVYDTASGGARLSQTCDHPAGASSCTAATRYTAYLYDNVGRQVRSTTYAGAPTGTEKLKTVTTYDAAGQKIQLDYTENGAGSPTDTLAFAYDLLGRQTTVSRGGSAITTTLHNADGTVATRTDAAISSTAAGFGYDALGNLTSATSPLYTGSATFTWGLDSLVTGRTWPGTSDAATFSYDGAKRPTQYAETASGSALATLSRGYDRLGSVNSETQTLTGVSGYAGGTAQTLTYDQLRRVTGSTLGTITRAYTYDADSNRLTSNESGTTTTYTYDRTDELTTQQVGAGTVRSATYDAYGNLTSEPNPDGTATFTTYTNNLNDVLTGQTPASGSGAVTYTIDALGRHRTQVAGGVTNTYSYAGFGPTVVQIANSTTTTNSAIDALGSRLATKTSAGGFGWLVPDLHGNIAAAVNSAGTAISDAFRYDPYGKVVASATSSLPTPWRYQGRLLESSGSDPALYDFGFRSYDTGLGAFTSLDDVAGSAMNPITFNRFLYADANPATLSDPSGHTVIIVDDAYGTTITTDATHKHVVHHQTTAARIKAWKALDWATIYAKRNIERTAQLASDAALRVARDAGAARRARLESVNESGPDAAQGAATAGVTSDQSAPSKLVCGYRVGCRAPSNGNGLDLGALLWNSVVKPAVDLLATAPYAVYYGAYNAAHFANHLGCDNTWAVRDVTCGLTHVASLPLAIPEGAGLGVDLLIDKIKGEDTGDEGRQIHLNPLHSYSPSWIPDPTVYGPGIHSDGSVDFEW